MKQDLLLKDECYKIIGACFEVYKEMGAGFLESVYQECLEIEFTDQLIPFIAQKQLNLRYKTKPLKNKYIPDFICYDSVIVEIKAVKNLDDNHKAQVINYLKATGFQLGLLVNFNSHPKLQYERLVLSK
tara:strand:- start:551 stop:937 length:387 start_codon:yes stop_codon:yes gene_type:complete